jgi:hypothetical protein
MDSQPKRADQVGAFETALSLLHRRGRIDALGTGSPELDGLIGGLEPGLFYLFYGSEAGGLPDRLLLRLLVEAVGRGRAIYLVCGNYRRSRTVLDSERLLSLVDGAGLDPDDALSRVHVVCAFSERHLIRAPGLVEDILGSVDDVVLVAVQQLAKLFHGKLALRHEDPSEFTGVISRLRELSCERGFALAASCRSSGRGRPAPMPEGGSFLRHAANAIVYLRASRRRGTVSAHLMKHPDSARSGRMVSFGEEGWAWEG